MTDTEKTQQPQSSTVLIAHVTVHLTSGESFELLPFLDDQDVKSKVTGLLDDWSKSGYLVRGGRIYPWVQVKLVEATSVSEVSRRESEQRLEEWQASDLAHLQQSFWKTKQPRKKNNAGEHEKDQAGPPPPS